MQPSLDVSIEIKDNLIIVDVPDGNDKPYACSRGFFIRNGANSQKLTRNEIIEFFQKEGRIRFDEMKNEKAVFENDFDERAFKDFLNLAGITHSIDRMSLLRNLDCITDDGKFTNAGVLFFARDIDFLLNHAIVVCVLYRGTEKVNILDKKDFKGNIVESINNAILFVKRHTNVQYKIEKLGGVGYWTGGGTPSKRNSSYWNDGDVLWVSPKDMKTMLIVDTEDKITRDSIDNSSAKWIAKGSVLFVVRSGIIRRVLPIALAGKDLTTNQDLQSLTLFWGDNNYVFWYCQANEQIIRDKCAKDGTTVDNIEVSRLKSYPIAICSLPEQQAIVQEIEIRLSVCDKIEQDIETNLERAEALRQSILKKAFEGKLLNERELAEVRRAEDWEPVGVLLERIKAEKAGNGKEIH